MDDNKNFLDKNTVLAIGLSILFFVGWQFYVSKKYPDAKKNEKIQTASNSNIDQSKKNPNEIPEGPQSGAVKKDIEQDFETKEIAQKETVFDLDYENFKATLTSKGMSFKEVVLKKYSDRDESSIRFFNHTKDIGNFATLYNNKSVYFSVEKLDDTHFVGMAQVGNQTIKKEISIVPENYSIKVQISTVSGQPQPNEKIETQLSNKVLKIKTSMFTPAYEGSEFFTLVDGSEEREKIDIESKYAESYKSTSLSSIGTHYFAIAVKDESDLIPQSRVYFDPADEVAYTSLFHETLGKGGKTSINYIGFIGPKQYDVLNNLGPEFVEMIDYGMFSILSKPILKMLKWLYGMLSNWGLAIILLTVFIRLLLLPINISSFKSMKKMQKIQPQLKAIKEKYKEDPQKVNQETMALMKKEKANPIGGCLPMLLQLPVFLALYSVLGQSVELYKSPFIFWIQDLSYQDPFFVLPVAVGILYFVQMSLSPTPMDPAQAKVMKFIPILFCFFMITVPSGLTLYFFVNTVFGIGQQFIFQREKRKAAV